MQLEHINFLEVLRHSTDAEALSKFRRVVLIYNEPAIDIDQQQRILVLIWRSNRRVFLSTIGSILDRGEHVPGALPMSGLFGYDCRNDPTARTALLLAEEGRRR